MAYRFDLGDAVGDNVRRLAAGEIEAAIADLRGREPDTHKGVHGARKRMKKIRGLLRLARPALGDRYRPENQYFRDIARRLSGARDAAAVVEALDDLREAVPDLPQEAVAAARRRLAETRDGGDDDALRALAAGVATDLEGARERAAAWTLDTGGRGAVVPGFVATYRRGRKAMRRAEGRCADDDRHDWRKRVKYHWYHVRLLEPLAPAWMGERRAALEELSEALGDERDLANLAGVLARDPDLDRPDGSRAVLLRAIDDRRAALRRHADDVGARVYAKKPKKIRRALRGMWAERGG